MAINTNELVKQLRKSFEDEDEETNNIVGEQLVQTYLDKNGYEQLVDKISELTKTDFVFESTIRSMMEKICRELGQITDENSREKLITAIRNLSAGTVYNNAVKIRLHWKLAELEDMKKTPDYGYAYAYLRNLNIDDSITLLEQTELKLFKMKIALNCGLSDEASNSLSDIHRNTLIDLEEEGATIYCRYLDFYERLQRINDSKNSLDLIANNCFNEAEVHYQDEFEELLEETDLDDKSTYYCFSREYDGDKRFQRVVKDKKREIYFMDYVTKLKEKEVEIKNRIEYEYNEMLKEREELARVPELNKKRHEVLFKLFNEESALNPNSSWIDVRDHILETDKYTRFTLNENELENEFEEWKVRLNELVEEFKTLLRETKIITHESKEKILHDEGHLSDILSALGKDKRYWKIPTEQRILEVKRYILELGNEEPK